MEAGKCSLNHGYRKLRTLMWQVVCLFATSPFGLIHHDFLNVSCPSLLVCLWFFVMNVSQEGRRGSQPPEARRYPQSKGFLPGVLHLYSRGQLHIIPNRWSLNHLEWNDERVWCIWIGLKSFTWKFTFKAYCIACFNFMWTQAHDRSVCLEGEVTGGASEEHYSWPFWSLDNWFSPYK